MGTVGVDDGRTHTVPSPHYRCLHELAPIRNAFDAE